jgi:hypothetical protein
MYKFGSWESNLIIYFRCKYYKQTPFIYFSVPRFFAEVYRHASHVHNHVHNHVPPAHSPGSSLPPLEPPSKPSFQHRAGLVITTPAQLHRIITTSRSRGGAFGWFIALILCTAPKFYAKSIKRPSKQASRTISVKQAKPASSRCLKLQASKLKALSLACLLITNSD